MRPRTGRGLYGERQALEARLVDEPSIIVAAVIRGGGVAALRRLLAVARPRAAPRSPVAPTPRSSTTACSGTRTSVVVVGDRVGVAARGLCPRLAVVRRLVGV